MFWVTDEQAMWRVRAQNDARAFALLIERWRPRIYSLCCRMLGDLHSAEDIAQEVFTRIYSHRNQYLPQHTFSSYIWRIALNLCHDEIRYRNCKVKPTWHENATSDDKPIPSPEPAPDEQMMHTEQAQSVKNALMHLEEPYRQVVILRHYENLKFREIAEVLDVPEGTVKSRMAEALNQLHNHLNRELNPLPVSNKTGASQKPSLEPRGKYAK